MWNLGRLKFFLTESTRNEIPLQMSQRRISKASNIWTSLNFFKLTYSQTAPSQIHCKDTVLKIRNKFSQEGIARPQSHFHIHVSVSDLYIPRIGLPILLQENMWTDPGNI
jgi:hypothetical protein